MHRPSADRIPEPTVTTATARNKWVCLNIARGMTYYLTVGEAFRLADRLVDAAEEQQRQLEQSGREAEEIADS